MRKAWFCYEATSTGVAPVIQYDEPSNQKNPLNPRVVQMHELGEEWERVNDEIKHSFEELEQAFPYIKPLDE